MENEKVEEIKVDPVDLEVGEDAPQVEAKHITVEDIEIQRVTYIDKRTKKETTQPMLVIKAKHPDVDHTIEISKVMYRKGDIIKLAGLWVTFDKDGKIVRRSSLGALLVNANAKTPRDLKGLILPTESCDNDYLAIKAY